LLIAKAATFDTALAHLCEAGFLTGARFGELASASVRDLNAARHTLRVDGKTGERVVSLTAESAEFLRQRASGRAPDVPLLPRLDGSRWPRSWHHKAIKRAGRSPGERELLHVAPRAHFPRRRGWYAAVARRGKLRHVAPHA
jgi:integrase